MADRSHHIDPWGDRDDELHPAPRDAAPGAPSWVKISAAVAVVLVVLLGALHLTGNGVGGPGSHAPATEQGGERP